MKRILIAVVVLGGMAWAGEATSGKLLDVQSHMVANNSVLGRWARSDGGSAVIPDARRVISITVLIEDMQYTANFMAGKHLATGALVIGDPLVVRLDKDKMFIKGDDGKEVRGYVVRRERVTSSPAQ